MSWHFEKFTSMNDVVFTNILEIIGFLMWTGHTQHHLWRKCLTKLFFLFCVFDYSYLFFFHNSLIKLLIKCWIFIILHKKKISTIIVHLTMTWNHVKFIGLFYHFFLQERLTLTNFLIFVVRALFIIWKNLVGNVFIFFLLIIIFIKNGARLGIFRPNLLETKMYNCLH